MALLDEYSTTYLSPYVSLPLLLGSVIAIYFVRAAYAAFTNPLSSIPGPEISRWTDFYIRVIWLAGRRPQYVHALHQKYGPIVRVAPDEVDISDISAAREIHRVGVRFVKSKFYRLLGPIENLFTTTDPKFHSNRRRLLSPFFTESSMRDLEPIILERVRLAVSKIEQELKTQSTVDVLKWWTLMAMDVIGELSFGESFHMLEAGKKNQYATDIASAASLHPIRTTFPTLVRIAAYLPVPFFKDVAQAGQRVFAYARKCMPRYKELLANNSENPKPMLFTNLLKAGHEGLSELDLTFESQSYITAGTDTTAVTMTYLVYVVCRHMNVRDTLVEELRSTPENLTYDDVRNLPYLNHVVDEALRIYGATPGALPRMVPEGGATLTGYDLPGKVTVSTQAYSLHRDPTAFPEPEKFDPSRWETVTKEMKDAFMPFGAGTRSCIGIHLARMELRLATALFFRTFPTAKVSTKEGMSDSDMEQKIFFLALPKGHRCLIEL